MTMKIFDLYDVSEIQVEDPGLKRYINVEPRLVLKTHGRDRARFEDAKVNVVERLARLLGCAGHRGKKNKIMLSVASGKFNKNMKIVLEALKIIHERTKQNPVQVLVKAIEAGAPVEEITVIEYGGARYPQSVDCSPTRRINLALRNMVHGASDKAFGKKVTIAQALANEIILATQQSSESFAWQKRNEAEKQAASAR
jgi:small subunit ribosomal protein S7